VAFSSNDLKNGMTLDLPEGLFQVVDFQHVKPGKGGAFVRTKLKNLRTGGTQDRTFRGGEPLNQAIVEKREMQLLYKDADGYVFMDIQTYDQLTAPAAALGDAPKYLKDSDNAVLAFYRDEIIGVELPSSVDLQVADTEPGVQGDRVSGAKKLAQLETGVSLQVPLFINTGDMIRVDTRTGDYLTRV